MNNDRIKENFLNAITEYAKRQERQFDYEVLEFKNSELKRAEDESLQEAYELIQRQIADKRAAIKVELASKEQDDRAQLFKDRRRMVDEVFLSAAEKLKAFTETTEYKQKLISSAKKMKELFEDYPSTVYMRSEDISFSRELAEFFGENTTFAEDKSIKLGGIKGVCPTKRIRADETFDTLLESERRSFEENSTLKIV